MGLNEVLEVQKNPWSSKLCVKDCSSCLVEGNSVLSVLPWLLGDNICEGSVKETLLPEGTWAFDFNDRRFTD